MYYDYAQRYASIDIYLEIIACSFVHPLINIYFIGAVLCVRWSNIEGRYLASGSDNDNTIIIWELDR
jgi:WD40 repeat protein